MKKNSLDLIFMSHVNPMAGVDPRRKQELADSRMIQEDHSKVSNLSEHGFQKEFNPSAYPERLAMYKQSDR